MLLDILLQIFESFGDMDAMTKIIGVVMTAVIAFFAAMMKTKIFGDFMSGIIFNISGNMMNKSGNFFKRIFKIKSKSGDHRKKSRKKSEEMEEVSSPVKETDIYNHDLFNYLDFWLYNQIPSVQLKTQYRTAIFRKYLHIYFKTYKDSILDFIREGEFKEMDGSKLRKQLLKLITDTTQKMEMEMRQINIPEVIIVKMKSVLNDRINLTMDLINSICDSSFYDSPDNLLKIYSFLNIIHSILDNTISNVEPVCNKLNGELSGLSIDGYIEPMSGSDNNI